MIEFRYVSLKLADGSDKQVRTVSHEGIICVPLSDLIQILADKPLLKKLLDGSGKNTV